MLISTGTPPPVSEQREQLVCSDACCGSGVAETRTTGQFFHTLGCEFGHVAKDRYQPLFSFRYGHCFTIADSANCML
jgi:hypothetical protein